MDFTRFDSSIILILRGGIPRPTENFAESLSQSMLVGIILVRRLGVKYSVKGPPEYCQDGTVTHLNYNRL